MPEKVKDDLYLLRHGLAHVLAQAMLEIRPGSKLGFGPPIDDGFYYDFILSEPIEESDFKEIEKRMRKIINQKQAFTEENLPYDEAMARIDGMGEPYKKQYAQELFDTREGLDSLRFYTMAPSWICARGRTWRTRGSYPLMASSFAALPAPIGAGAKRTT